MQFTIDREPLLEELTVARKYLSKTVPALGNFLFEADDKLQRVTIAATDTQNTILCYLNAQVKKAGSWILSAQQLYGAVRNLPAQSSITIKEESGAAGNTAVILTSGKTKLKIPTISASSFITIPYFMEDNVMEMPSEDLIRMVETTSFAKLKKPASSNDFKFEGINMKVVQGVATFTCTDRARIAFGRYHFSTPTDAEFILHAKSLEDFVSGLRPGEIVKFKTSHAGRISIEAGDRLLLISTYSDQYPDVARLVPTPTSTITVNREELIAKLEIAQLVDTKVELKAKGSNLYLSAAGHGTGEFQDAIAANVKGPTDITFRIDYFLEGLKVMEGQEVELLLTDSLKPAIVRPKGKTDYVYLLIPVA